jgi:haloacetate dehalogenase
MLTSRHNDDEEPGTRLRLLQFHDVMGRRSAGPAPFDPRALAECKRCMSLPGCARGICEDYRAAAGIDLEHDRADRKAGRMLKQPLSVCCQGPYQTDP